MLIETLPTIEAIQRTSILVAICAAAALFFEVSAASAIACILGAALMVANLTALSWTARAMFALARDAGGANWLGLAAAPLKMLVLVALVYLIVESGRVNVPGFIGGVLTQFAGIFIEVGRAYFRKSVSLRPKQQEG